MKNRILITSIMMYLFSTPASALNYCNGGTSNESDDIIMDARICKTAFCNTTSPSETLLFDRDSVYLFGHWTWKDTIYFPRSSWTFQLHHDNTLLTSRTDNTTTAFKYETTPSLGAINGQFLPLGNHSLSVSVTTSAGKSCSDSIPYRVERTQIHGLITEATQQGVKGAMCIRGVESGRRKSSPQVDIYAGADMGSASKIATGTANAGSSANTVNNNCGDTQTGFNVTLSERQQADFCEQRLWAAVKNPDGTNFQIPGSGDYNVPCALRPFIDSYTVVTSTNPWRIILSGSNFKNGTKVEIYDNNNLWATGMTTLSSSDSLSFSLPANEPPSACNITSTCNIRIRTTNPAGASQAIFTEKIVTLPKVTPPPQLVNCPTGRSWTISALQYNGTTPNQCGVDRYGRTCPFSPPRAEGPGHYPNLRFTCL